MVLVNDNEDARLMIEQCFARGKTVLNPIIDWEDDDVWEFIHEYKVPYCELYDQGYKRLGCIGCPMNTTAKQELERYPAIKKIYLRAFERMLEVRKSLGKDDSHGYWTSAENVMEWWLKKR